MRVLANDRHVLGPWVNSRWLNVVSGVIIGSLLVLSSTLLITTIFPATDTTHVLAAVTVALIGGSAIALSAQRLTRRPLGPAQNPPPVDRTRRGSWRTPPLATLPPYTWSPTLRLAMILLRGYLILCAVLLIIKVIQLSHP